MELALYILLGLLALFVALLTVPLRLKLHIERDGTESVLRYGPFTVFDSARVSDKKPQPEKPSRLVKEEDLKAGVSEESVKKAAERKAKEKKKAKKPKEPSRSFRNYTELGRQIITLTPQVLSALFRLGYRTLKQARVENLEGYLGGGLDDPALTGELAGYGYALAGALPYRAKKFRIEPDYMAERLEFELDTTISFRPIRALPPAFGFVRELPKRKIYQLIKTFRRKTDE